MEMYDITRPRFSIQRPNRGPYDYGRETLSRSWAMFWVGLGYYVEEAWWDEKKGHFVVTTTYQMKG